MKRILCLGEALIDFICTDKGVPLEQGQHFLKKAGGAPVNVAAAISAMGGHVSVCCTVGDDPFGHHLLHTFTSFGIDVSLVRKLPQAFTTLAFVSLLHSGERDFYFNRGADALLDQAMVNEIDFTRFQMVHFGSATAFLPGPLQQSYLLALRKAREAGCFISFDPNYRELLYGHQQAAFVAQAWPFIEQCQFFKVSNDEALLITGQSSVHHAALALQARTQASFAITLGAEGTLLSVHNQLFTLASVPARVVDTTGAGDAFAGAVLYQLSCHEAPLHTLTPTEWAHMASQANRAGARTCEHLGAMEAFALLGKSLIS